MGIQNGYDISLRNRIWFYKYGEALWQGRSGEVRRLWIFGLLFVRQGVLRKSTVRILLRLSRDSFMPEKFCTS
jgi:hypothetical protein